jgi:polyisoprenoid-binding protein YceI
MLSAESGRVEQQTDTIVVGGGTAGAVVAARLAASSDRRDAHLRSADFLDVEHYPQITFKTTRIVPEGGDEFKVFGDLTIHGVTRPVVLNTEYNGQSKAPWGTEVIGFSAETKVSRKDFGLIYNPALETGGVVVGDEVKIRLEVEATKQS